jgi:hypothetical protein
MNESSALTHFGQIILARLLVAGEKGATGSDLRKALEPLAGHRWAGSALGERIEQALVELVSARLIQRPLLVRKTERVTITEPGRAAMLGILGLDQLPPKTTWDKLKKTYLAARALGLPTPRAQAAKSFAGDPGFKAALLKTKYDLPVGDYPSFDQAIDALAWTLLGFPSGRKFDMKAVKTALIRRAIGDAKELEAKPDPKKEAAKLLAKAVGARQAGKDELRLSALRHWVDEEGEATASAARVPSPSAPVDDLETFARRVVEAARSSPTGQFGANKVFVAHVWRMLQDDPAIAALGFDGFKNRLAEANNARFLDLSRADLVEAMDPEDVRLSEVSYLGATFHFIRT